MKVPDGTLRILVQGGERIKITDYVSEDPYLVARIEPMPDVLEPSAELEALTRNVQNTFSEIIEQIPYLPEELQLAVANLDDPSALGHLIAGALRISVEEKQELLEEVDVGKRLRRLSEILTRELEVVRLGTKIQSQVESEIDKGQREYFLRQQLKAIQEELGEGDDQQAEIDELRERIEAADLPEEPQQGRPSASWAGSRSCRPPAAEYGVIRTYLEWLVDLPWSKETEDNLEIEHARKVLDEDHYDLEKVKDRILEYLAVRKLNPESPGPILCFVGPPGVGKTSLGKSIARALGREFERISVGGVRDEAEIRGHRRTYIGAMPGHDHPRAARRRHPQPRVHDRRDRQDGRGLPRRPGQRDARGARPGPELDLPRPLPGRAVRPLRRDLHRDGEHARPDPAAAPGPHGGDPARRLHGRREAPHRQAATSSPASSKANGLKTSQVELADPALKAIIEEYTREAGVRNLEREIGTVFRKVARQVAEGKANGKVTVSAKRARELLGKRRVLRRAAPPHQGPRRGDRPRLDPGRRRGPVHRGDASMTGSGKLTITGQLGDVMRESAQAALSYVRGHCAGAGSRARRRLVRRERHPHPRPGGGRPQGRALGRRRDDDRARLAHPRQGRSATTWR